MSKRRKDNLAPPLMVAFRSAFEERDARKPADLRDDGGERVIASRRNLGRVAITEPALRREVSRDIGALLNTVNLDSVEDLCDFPAVRRSVLNYGLPDLVHRSLGEGDLGSIGRELEEALTQFEPRLARRSLVATRDTNVDEAELKIRFLIRADLQCEPVNVPVEFVADVEIDTGKIRVERL